MSITVLLITIFATLLFAMCNIVDDWLVNLKDKEGKKSEDEGSPMSLLAIGGLFFLGSAVVLGALTWFRGIAVHVDQNFMFLVASGFTFTVAMGCYLYALKCEEVCRAASFFQFIPVFGLFGGYYFLNESLTPIQIGAIVLLAFGGIILSVSNGVFNRKMVLLMLVSSFMFNVNDVTFANYGRNIETLPALLADSIGKAAFGLIILLKREYRNEFMSGLRMRFAVQTSNEVAFTSADMMFDWAKILAPVALVQGMCATQPLFLLILSALFTKYVPSFHSENFVGVAKWQKVIGVLLMVVGGVIVSV